VSDDVVQLAGYPHPFLGHRRTFCAGALVLQSGGELLQLAGLRA